MYYMINDAFDYFAADFTQEESIAGAEHHPLGYYAVEALEKAYHQAAELRGPVRRFQKDMQAFLAARDPSSMAEAYQSAKRLWWELERLPVYNKLLVGDHRINALLPYMRRHPEEVDDILQRIALFRDGEADYLQGIGAEATAKAAKIVWTIVLSAQSLSDRGYDLFSAEPSADSVTAIDMLSKGWQKWEILSKLEVSAATIPQETKPCSGRPC